MFKKILVPTDGSDAAKAGEEYAIGVATSHGAELTALFVVDSKLLEGPFLRDISSSLGTAPYVNYQSNVRMILEERGKAALASFESRCVEAGVAVTTQGATGPVVKTIAEASGLADLIVLGRSGEHYDWLEGVIGSTTDGVIRHAHCPVVVTGRAEASLERFVLAYDGSEKAKEALHIAAAIGEHWGGACAVLAVTDDDAAGVLDEAKSYLDAHEIAAEYVTRPGDPRSAILEYCSGEAIDLLVMGAHGHSRVHELLLGSTTAHVVHHSSCPVLLAR